MDQNEIPQEPHHLEFHRVHPKWFPILRYVWRKPYTYLAPRLVLSLNRSKWASTWASSLRSTIGCPKWLLSLWYVWHKPCTYLESRLALYPNRPKWASSWASSPRRTVRCVQNDFYDWRKPYAYLALTLTLSMNVLKRDSKRVHPKWFPSLWYIRRKLCTYLASRLELSPNGPKRASTWASSARRTVGCIQNNFYVWHKPSTYLVLTQTPSPNELKRDLTWPTSPRIPSGESKMISERMLCLA
jgi:hypothetical protein